jgi:type II secretory ATPase GspE/PulE/Tfp pilus assembly ATPase PilB-like protein
MKNKAEHSDVVTLVDDILAGAIGSGASDIHFEPGAESMVIKYRLDGELKVTEELPKFLAENVIRTMLYLD